MFLAWEAIMKEIFDLIVIGGGAAGLADAVCAA